MFSLYTIMNTYLWHGSGFHPNLCLLLELPLKLSRTQQQPDQGLNKKKENSCVSTTKLGLICGEMF